MKSILLHIDSDTCMEARKQAALDIARTCDGHITCLQSVSYEVFAPGDIYGSAMAAAMPQIKKAAEKLRAEMEADLANEDVPWEWRFIYGQAEHRLLEQSALHDIIIIGPHDIGEADGDGPSTMAGDLALRAAAPVLVVPGHTKRLDLSAPIAIAWNGSSEASVALRSAIPLLVHSNQVTLITISEKKERKRIDFSALEAAAYLSRYGISAEVSEVPRGEAKIADTLSSEALRLGSSIMVMGAFGHSRLTELLLGGVTRRSLTDPQLPILLAH